MASLEASVGEGSYSLFDGEPPIDLSWILKFTEDEVPAAKVSVSSSSSPERPTSSGYGSSQGEDQVSSSTTPSMGQKMELNPWVTPFHPSSNSYNYWPPIPTPPPTPTPTPRWTPSQSVAQTQEPILLWSSQGRGFMNGGRYRSEPMMPSPILDVGPQVISLEPNGDKYWGITVDKCTDRLYIGDRCGSEIILLDPTVGKPVLQFGQENILRYSSNQLYRPTGLVVDETHRRLLICDKDNHRICIYTLDGHFVSSFGKKGHGQSEFNYPWDIDTSPNGNMIVVSDSKNHRIQFFDRFGNYLKKFTVFESDPFEYKKYFDYPRGITFDNEGKKIYCTDFNTNNVVCLDVESLHYNMLVQHGKLNRPQGITVSEAGNLLVCDSRRNCVRVVNPRGDLLKSWNRVGPIALTAPVDSCVLGGGQLATLAINGSIHFF